MSKESLDFVNFLQMALLLWVVVFITIGWATEFALTAALASVFFLMKMCLSLIVGDWGSAVLWLTLAVIAFFMSEVTQG